VGAVARHLEVSEQTYHRWRNQFGGKKADDVKRLKELEAGFDIDPRRGTPRPSIRLGSGSD
jgi:transposase-like protein